MYDLNLNTIKETFSFVSKIILFAVCDTVKKLCPYALSHRLLSEHRSLNRKELDPKLAEMTEKKPVKRNRVRSNSVTVMKKWAE